jgi:hypothetical protein
VTANAPLLQTVAGVNYLPSVLVLASTVHESMPAARLCVLVTDATPAVLKPIRDQFGSSIEFICCDDLGIAMLEHARRYYTILEFNSACKVLALDYQIRVRGEPECFFIDPDMFVLDDFSELARAHGRDIVVTPHATRPYPDDGELPIDTELAASGYVNGGFIYVRNSKPSFAVLDWLVRQTRYSWFVAPTFGMYADQHWLSMLLFIFEGTVGLLRNPAINIAYWNLHERPLHDVGDAIMVGTDVCQRALLFHFSGFATPSRGRLSKHSDRRFDPGTERALVRLINTYEQLLTTQRDRVVRTGISGDLGFSRKSLTARMKVAQAYWGNQFTEFAPMAGRLSRLSKVLDRLLS